MLLNGFSSQLSPSQSSNVSLGFTRDYTAGLIPFLGIHTHPPTRPYFTQNDTTLTGAGGGEYLIETLNLQSSQINQAYVCSRTMCFNFRPFYNLLGDYQQNPGKFRYAYIPSVIVFNQRTGQTVHIRAQQLPLESVTVGGVVTSYVPQALVVQGAIPFYFDLNDTVELCYVDPGGGGYGKLALNFFNFDTPSWYQTGVDCLVVAT